MVSKYLHNESELARIDILNCPVEDDAEGKQMVQTLSKLVGVPIHTAKVIETILPAHVDICFSIWID